MILRPIFCNILLKEYYFKLIINYLNIILRTNGLKYRHDN